jgi:NDP-sugar pyrophosphorylase family protein
MSWLREGGIVDVAICANRETRVLESRLHRHVPSGMAVSYHEDAMPRGAAGAVRDAAAASDDAVFVIVDGTAIPNVNLPQLLRAHHDSRATATVVVHAEADRSGRPSLQVPTGIYVFNRQVLDFIPATGFFDIKENLIPRLHQAGEQVSAYEIASASPRVLDASTYLAVNEWMIEHLVAGRAVPDGYVRSGSGLLHRDAVIDDGAMCVGPVLVGPGATVRSGAVIVGPTSIGREALVDSGALVSRSAIWRRCRIQENAAVDRCIIGDDAVIAAGTQTLRQIRMSAKGREVEIARSAMASEEASSLELFKRMSRAFLGTAWSRSPAAQ